MGRRQVRTKKTYDIDENGIKTETLTRGGKVISTREVAMNAEEEYAFALSEDRAAFDARVNEIETELDTAIGSTAIEDSARQTGGKNFDEARATRTRAQEMYGTAPKPNQSYQDTVSKQLGTEANIGMAVKAQHEYQQGARTAKANLQDMLQGNGMSMMAKGAAAFTDVENYNKQVEAQNKANTFKQIGGIAAGIGVGMVAGPYAGLATYGSTQG